VEGESFTTELLSSMVQNGNPYVCVVGPGFPVSLYLIRGSLKHQRYVRVVLVLLELENGRGEGEQEEVG